MTQGKALSGAETSAVTAKLEATGPTPRQREIAGVAASLFREKGYRETTVRDVASALEIKSASLYYHFTDKQDILFAIINGVMRDFVDEVTPKLIDRADPVETVSAVVATHLRFDYRNLDAVLVSARERRSLPPDLQAPINRMRAYHRLALRDVIEEGVESRVFAVDDAAIAAAAMLDLLSGVKEWFGPSGALSLDDLIAMYQGLALNLLRRVEDRNPEPRDP